jgi:hypothetical protein
VSYRDANVHSTLAYDRQWAIYNKKIYDLSDYLFTVQYYSTTSGTDLPNYAFLDSGISDLFQTNAGQDITAQMTKALGKLNTDNATAQLNCLNQAFYVGELDFRLTPRCTVQNWLLLAFSIILMSTIAAKCTLCVFREADIQFLLLYNLDLNVNRNFLIDLSFVKYHVIPKAKNPLSGLSIHWQS